MEIERHIFFGLEEMFRHTNQSHTSQGHATDEPYPVVWYVVMTTVSQLLNYELSVWKLFFFSAI
jgi:hypothetical protein